LIKINNALNESLFFANSTKNLFTDIKLADESVNLYLFNANELSEETVALFAHQYLCTSELAIYDQRKALLTKKEFVASRLLIKYCAFKLLSSLKASSPTTIDFKQIIVEFNEDLSCLEVSYQQQLLPLTVSLSHSQGVVFLGVILQSKQQNTQLEMQSEWKHELKLKSQPGIQLGVDIELISDKRNHQKLAKHFFHPTEIEWVAAKGQSAFFRVWTLKEALAKASKVSVASLLAKNVFEQLESFNGSSGVSYASCQHQYQNQHQNYHQSKASKNTFDISIVFNTPLKVVGIQEIDIAAYNKCF